MPIDSVLRLPEPPDLLRRFIETPLEQVLVIAGMRILVRTNHQGCYDSLTRHGVGSGDGVHDLTWTLVCDPDLPPKLGEVTLMESGRVAVLSFGRGCFMALQRDRMELKGFISSGVDEQTVEELIFPSVRELIATMEPGKVSHA
jgi:hypothetical protein